MLCVINNTSIFHEISYSANLDWLNLMVCDQVTRFSSLHALSAVFLTLQPWAFGLLNHLVLLDLASNYILFRVLLFNVLEMNNFGLSHAREK